MARRLTVEEKTDLYRTILDNPQLTTTRLAEKCGVKRYTVTLAKRQLMEAGFKALCKPAETADTEVVPPEPIEVHDTEFWRRQARATQKEVGKAQRVIEELGGIRNMRIQVPSWGAMPGRGRRGRAVIGMLVSDVHDGETIQADEILGINEYNPEVCEKRMRRYFQGSCAIASRWSEDCIVEGALVALAGDLISGDIHDELSRTNALTAHEQVRHAVSVLAGGIAEVKEAFGKVHVIGVPGNHGRTTKRPTAKQYSALSYDTLIVSMIADRFADDNRVTFQFGSAKDQITPIFGRTVHTTHGDKIGTRGGMGFAGPMLPIVRGAKKIIEQQGSVERYPDLIQLGHYHTTGNPYIGCPVLANGSVPGYSEFGDDLRAAVEPPQQWTYLLHDRWWLRERQPVILEELKTPELPRVRMPAGMVRV